MQIALIATYSHRGCTLKDVAGGFGTVFHIGNSWRAKALQRAKQHLVSLPHPTLGYLAAMARRAGHKVRLIEHRPGQALDTTNLDLALVLTSLVDADAEAETIASLKRAGVPAVAFGSMASSAPAMFDHADAVILGEPEALGPALFDPGLRGLVRAGDVPDLDALPWPDWSVFPTSRYRYGTITSAGISLPISGARGCTYGCSYCPFRVAASFRERSPKSIAAEAAFLAARYGARGLSFRDPLFNRSRARVLELAEVLEPLGLRFSIMARADRLDPELLERLARAGLRSLEMGVESADLAMLQRTKRAPPELAQVQESIAVAHRLGVRVVANFMLGLPEDTEARIRATVALAKRLNVFAVQFTVATPYPGTSMDREVRRLPGIGPQDHTGWEPTFHHPNLSPAQLRELREWAYVSYHFRPRYALRAARSAWDLFWDRPAQVGLHPLTSR